MPKLVPKEIKNLTAMDRPENLPTLKLLAEITSDAIAPEHFPNTFDLPRNSGQSADSALKPYRRRDNTPVTAIPMALVATPDNQPGDALFTYHKWDDTQTAKSGDWLVKNGDEVYTIDRQTFEDTYTATDTPGHYIKTRKVWAKRARESGTIQTKEGSTRYKAGDYLVFNEPNWKDGYAVSAATFSKLYEPEST